MKIAVAGLWGQVGRLLCHEIIISPHHTLIGGTYGSMSRPEPGQHYGLTSVSILDIIDQVDVLIDFSVAHQVSQNIKACQTSKKMYVGGVTNLDPFAHDAMIQLSHSQPVFYDTNMSQGIAVLKYIAGMAAELLHQADVEIHEVHHRYKKDSPSGTAISLANHIKNNHRLDAKIVNRHATNACLDKRDGARHALSEIGISYARGGGVLGRHDVTLGCDNEVITLSHQTYDRKIYAQGALKAAKWLSEQQPGLYSMIDLYSLKRF